MKRLALLLMVYAVVFTGCVTSKEEEAAEDARYKAKMAYDITKEIHNEALIAYTDASARAYKAYTDMRRAGHDTDAASRVSRTYGSEEKKNAYDRMNNSFNKVRTAYSRALEMHSRAWSPDTPEAWNEAHDAWDEVTVACRKIY